MNARTPLSLYKNLGEGEIMEGQIEKEVLLQIKVLGVD